MSSLQKCLLRYFAHFLIVLVVVELYELFEYFGDYAKGLLFLMCYYCKQSSAFLFWRRVGRALEKFSDLWQEIK